ncbi:hypothetical protein [Kitasatospora phosalacinea]|uniref:hypothetical protein n=1 Tax=Kitasatospora phosalacinea TaxID=2065 RepID=UPI002553EB3F|nr:hypothetical protein [Kitasatospora phosalacinea]
MAAAHRKTVGEFPTRPDERVRALPDVLVDGRIDDLQLTRARTSEDRTSLPPRPETSRGSLAPRLTSWR